MFRGAGIFIPFRESKINQVNCGLIFAQAYQEIIRFYVSVQEATLVYILNPLDHLNRDHQHCFKGKLSPAVLKQVLQRWPQ